MLMAFNFSLARMGVRSQLLLSAYRGWEGLFDLTAFHLQANEGRLVEL